MKTTNDLQLYLGLSSLMDSERRKKHQDVQIAAVFDEKGIVLANLLQAGMALVPIPLGSKSPNAKNWNLPSNCVTNPAQANSLDGLNVGLAHAYCTPSPTCALDIDNYPNAKDWLASHDIELDSLWKAQDAVVILSGKKNSMKLLYKLSGNISPLESKKIVGPDGSSALEFRCATKDGKTVQDVLPPSMHPDGHQYRWMGSGDPTQMPEIPQQLLELWLELISKCGRVAKRQCAFSGISHLRQETPREIATIDAALKHIDADCDYETWRNIVWAILSTGWTCAEDLAIAWSQSAPERFEDDAFWLVANSYIPGHKNQITVGSIYYFARNGGWNG
jgi:hypothetical protein